MSPSKLRRAASAMAVCAIATLPSTAQACAACTGGAIDTPTTNAMNGAIFFMLGCIGSTLLGIVSIGVVMVKRSHTPLPPHAQFSSHLDDDTF